ncbi:SNF2 family N-terminal domain-containing protein [Xylariaceae sp. FL0804]|nr:SNF2 family N-terminal domain-containing protein [Xylariaceae sp. FL0804]
MASLAPQPGPQSRQELLDEMQVAQILLDSLEGTPEDTPEYRRELKDQISQLDRQLKAETPAKEPSSTSADEMFGFSNGNMGRTHVSPSDMLLNDIDIFGHPGTHPRMSDYDQLDSSDPSRKRTFSTHNGYSASLGPSKSRRTTPSPSGYELPSLQGSSFDYGQDFIDLSGQDDNELSKNWTAGLQPPSGNHRPGKEDGTRLRGRHSGEGLPFSPSPIGSLSGPSSFPRQASNGHRPADAHGLSANGPPPLATSRPSASPLTGRIASHIKSESPTQGLQRPSNSDPFSSPSRGAARQQRYKVPGAYYSESDDESVFIGASGSRPGLPYIAGMPGFASASSLPTFSSQFSLGGYGVRPGYLQNGYSNPLEPSPLSARPNRGSTLGDIISQTGAYDYENGLDAAGNPLPPDLLSLYGLMERPGDNEKQIKELLANIRPDAEIAAADREGTPRELKCGLHKHQKLALTWMKSMEAAEKKRGGILADDMGLGKTISTLALIVSNKAPRPPPSGKSFSRKRLIKTTLIVCPVSLISQWSREIRTKLHDEHQLSCFAYHNKKVTYDQLCTYDVVLTTYGTLASQHNKMDQVIRRTATEGGVASNAELTLVAPLLAPTSMFYRVVLDEAQYIKSDKTKSARGARDLKAKYRWCLTGTPMMNKVSELASLISFLRIEPYCQPRKFQQQFGCLDPSRAHSGNRNDAMRQLQVLIKATMLRRTKDSQLDGQPIIELPPKTEEVVEVAFSEAEQQFYNDLLQKGQVQVSRFLREGTIGKHYSHVLVLLLRCRQACCHPYLQIADFESTNIEVSKASMVALAKNLAPEVVRRIKEADGFLCPICTDAVENPSLMVPCGHDICSDCFVQLIESTKHHNVQAGQEHGGLKCPQCRGELHAQSIIGYDVFRKVHMPETVPQEDSDVDEETASDDSDGSETESDTVESLDDTDEKGNLKGFIVDDGDEEEEDEEKPEVGTHGDKKPSDDDLQSSDLEDITEVVRRMSGAQAKDGKGKGKAPKPKRKRTKTKKKAQEVQPHMLKHLRAEGNKNKAARAKYMSYLEDIYQPSAKVDKCRELLAEFQLTGEKTLVFSQWTLLLDLIEVQIKKDLDIDICRYDGSMAPKDRENAVREFMDNDNIKVMLVSLKAGNSGLNLMAASRIIIMDPFWNPYIEMQAVDRAHRLGQSRPVKVHRILTSGTVEDRIMEIQAKKRDLVDNALSEQAAGELGRLSTKDLAYIFGIGSR